MPPTLLLRPDIRIPDIPHFLPLPDRSCSLFDTWGIACFLGGDEAVSSMSSLHVYGSSRWWMGWYNSPGSYQLAKQLSLLEKSRFFDGLSSRVYVDPATLDKLSCPKGPKFRASKSGTIIEETSHLAALFTEECAAREGKIAEGRMTQPVGVTIAELNHVPETEMYPTCTNPRATLFSSIPILVSTSACVACGLFGDWYSFVSILFGILAHGICCFIIGSGKFAFTHPRPSEKCPPGDGILGTGKEIVLLKGKEGAVNSITRGKFSLEFPSDHKYQYLRWCPFLLKLQTIVQLSLVPVGSLFGQVMFVTSLSVSWIYNSWLSSDKTEVQRDILLKDMLQNPELTRYVFGTRTTAVVFILLVLHPEEPDKILNKLLPNNTRVWRVWKNKINELLLDKRRLEFAEEDWELVGVPEEERSLLKTLYGDAEAAHKAHAEYVTSRRSPFQPFSDDVDTQLLV